MFRVCLCFHSQIVLDNKAHSGKVKISLDNEASIKECKDPNVSGHGTRGRRGGGDGCRKRGNMEGKWGGSVV